MLRFLLLALVLASPLSGAAEVISQPLSACPTPHNDCAAACGTNCTYWTCGDYTNIPVPINRLPMTFIRANAQCTQRLEEVVINQLPLTRSQQDRMVDQVNHLPMSFRADSHACVSQVKAGPACTWSAGNWSTCSASCGGGTQTRTVTCSGAYCDPGTKPATSQACNAQMCDWIPGSWSGCSAACGGGTQTRSVTCGGAFCEPATKPAEAQACNVSACATNGVCGAANGTQQSSAPTANLCLTGSASPVNGAGPWSWTCGGSSGGTSATCSASLAGFRNMTIGCSFQYCFSGGRSAGCVKKFCQARWDADGKVSLRDYITEYNNDGHVYADTGFIPTATLTTDDVRSRGIQVPSGIFESMIVNSSTGELTCRLYSTDRARLFQPYGNTWFFELNCDAKAGR